MTKEERPHHAQQGCTGRLPILLLNVLRSQTLFYSLESGSHTCQACLTVIRSFQQIYIFLNYFFSRFFSLRPPPDLRLCSLEALVCEFCHTLEARSSVSPHRERKMRQTGRCEDLRVEPPPDNYPSHHTLSSSR